MNTIQILHTHPYDKESASQRAEEMLEDLANDYGLEIQTFDDGSIEFSGSGISGNVIIDHNKIQLSAKLGFLMVAMKSVIANAIEEKLKEKF
jgi:putative polyhydroxyalkanoate system protein